MKTQTWLDCGQGTLQLPSSGGSVTTEVVELKDFGRIFEVYHFGNEPEQTQRLILAAPELLAACQWMMDILEGKCGRPFAAAKAARAAIAKAKGTA
jgi:hypothetical protein